MKYFIAFCLLVIPILALAAGWSPPYRIVSANVYGDADTILVKTDSGEVLTEGCRANLWQLVVSDNEGRSRVYSALLSALMSGKKVSFWYLDSCGLWDYHKFNIISIKAE